MNRHAALQLREAYNANVFSVPELKAGEAGVCSVCGCGGVAYQIGDSGPREGRGLNRRTLAWQSTAHAGGPHLGPADTRQERGHAESGRRIALEQAILSRNDRQARQNRMDFAQRGIRAINLMSGPGAGKTSWLVRTLEALPEAMPAAVIEGDQQTDLDADRIRATGVPAVQINTGKGCHLDAAMVAAGSARLGPASDSLLFIENVGNLVCPAAFDLGETAKVVLLSVTEGQDKPLKYPDIFAAADLLVITKSDLLPHVEFDPQIAHGFAQRVNPKLSMLLTSARSGEGITEWLAWLAALPRGTSARMEEIPGG
ncbi:MAG: hydrogenase nickel incorporation protein HypB [Zoogloeaceae bacterium]|nr:hydrogenase nickel incorporation protein HypB [Zoogloeaceae bacterium]